MTPRNPNPRRRARPSFALMAAARARPLAAQAQNLIWENQGMTNAFGINSGSTYNYNGATVTLTWQTNGTGLAIYSGYGSNFVTYQAGMEGGHMGHVLLGFDAAQEETSGPNNFLTFTLTFSVAQSNLAFSILDIDQGSWDDAVEVRYNGTNVRNNSSLWSFANTNASLRTVRTDDEGYFVGWEGTLSNAATNQNYGNLDINLTGIAVTSIQIRYWCADDGNSNPGAQKIGISDLYVTPEPPALLAALLLPVLLLLARRRLRR